MVLTLIILYVITLIYLSTVERFRNYASIIAWQGWILLGIALLQLHTLNWVELGFIILETLIFKAIVVPAILMNVIKKTNISNVGTTGTSQFNAQMLSITALVVSAITTYYVADSSVHMLFFGVALYALLSGLILIVLRSRIFTHVVGFLVIEPNGKVDLLNLNYEPKDPISQILGFIEGSPDLIEKIKGLFSSKKDK